MKATSPSLFPDSACYVEILFSRLKNGRKLSLKCQAEVWHIKMTTCLSRILLILSLLGITNYLISQNPHGENFKTNCAACHSPEGWEIAREYWENIELHRPQVSKMTGMPLPVDTSLFHHNQTGFELTGQHANVDCRACHETLVFSEANTECITCHIDMHQMTAGSDCARCHSTENWLVDDVQQIHWDNGFPLIGAHAVANCADCHGGETSLQFGRIGNDCASCHLDEFMATTNPDHEDAGFSTNCIECHSLDNPNWDTEVVDHSFFPLEKGHDIVDCASCHTAGDFANTPSDCFACHQTDFENTLSPNHQAAGFQTDCAACHTTDVGWMPAQFLAHDIEHFPIYSRAHEGTWNNCVECHANESDYAVFSCTVCHANPETDNGHETVSGYAYENSACLACHPTGDVDGSFGHDQTAFPLTGAHIGVECLDCHTNGYAGTPTDCAACHQLDFDQTGDPNHSALGLTTDCAQCHTTELDWMPATFDNHDDFYQLNGAHAAIANDCAACHNGDYTDTPTDCVGCHQTDFDQTTDPNHAAVLFPTDCVGCHSEDAWSPATDYGDFHDAEYFPIYSGTHNGKWDECIDCHMNPSNLTEFTCITCHANPEMDDAHVGENGYSYESTACLACHPSGEADNIFDHNLTAFPLDGAHLSIECVDCHTGGVFAGTPMDCAACHQVDFDNSANPSHPALGISADCAMCHTTEPDWMPATFDIHDDFYQLNGAHIAIANECATCHNGDYVNTPNECIGCHLDEFNSTTGPDHQAAQLSSDCTECHNESVWTPSTFNHDFYPLNGAHAAIANECAECHIGGDYTTTPSECFGCHQTNYEGTTDPDHIGAGFSTDCMLCHSEVEWVPATFDHDNIFPVYSGAHEGVWSDCVECHATPGNYATFTCVSCHINPETDDDHVSVGGYVYESSACLACHPTGDADNVFDHNLTAFPLDGAHLTVECTDCHIGGVFAGTPTDCAACHQMDFDQSVNPNHNALGLPTDCAQCHTTEPDWMPASFAIHDDFYPLIGEHANIANDCAACHNGDYTNTPNMCNGCHSDDYNATTDPNHAAGQFPVDCESCHNQSDWNDLTLDHEAFYPLTGGHISIADDCVACHIGGNFFNTPNDCASCHQTNFNQSTNPNHGVLGLPSDCAQCHTTEPDWMPATFDIHDDFYPLVGAHAAIANDCAACHNGNYTNTPNECFGCHETEYNATTDPNHQAAQFSTDCMACHDENAWEPANFDHDGQYFPIYSGEHAGEWDECIECHTNPSNYAEFSCIGCHLNPETDNAHVGEQGYSYISSSCFVCHPTGSADDDFNHDNTGFPLTGEHITTDCIDCHASGYAGTPTDCAACHTNDFNNSTNPNHNALGLPMDCAQCHTTEPGWTPAEFPDHDDYWVIDGAHLGVQNDCAACHNGDYNNTPTDCVGCHQNDFDNSTNPNHGALGLPTDCAQCHTTEPNWMPATFDIHDDFYQLNGAHAAIANDCATCHNGNYNNTPNTCFGCHESEYNATTDPDHQAAQFPTDCTQCHSESEWTPSTLDHASVYPLTGSHAAIENECALCHINGNYSNTPSDCVGCHQDDFDNSTNPNHPALGLTTDCAQCHTTEPDWMPATFDIHDDFYQLNGAHATIANDCAACHNGNYNNTPNTCFGCHEDDYNNTTNPDHQALQFSTNCTDCHTETAWSPSTFDHSFYPLTGAHMDIQDDCIACHVGGNYSNTPNTCVGCHQGDYDQSTNPDHGSLGLSSDCESCHTTEPGWAPATFAIHDNYWVLDGAHLDIANDCAECHNGNYNNTPNTCDGCHMDDYNQSTNPNHIAANIPTDCAMCHTTEPGWNPATFPIHDDYWVIDGAHVPIEDDCAACHNGNYNNTPNTCEGCHMDDYNNSVNPNHVNLNIPDNCAMCHTTDPDWMPATFPIHDDYWPLNGAHAIIANDCVECHNGNYNNTPNTCFGCHEPDYNSATNPNHLAAQFPTDCQDCHTESSWVPWTVDHISIWPFTGAHVPIQNDCALCHVGGNYFNTPNTCEGCHMPDYNASVNPNHQALDLPNDCAMCHTTDPDWMPATFPIHDNFHPLNGAHAVIADDCVECHNGDYNNTPNTCFGCHQSEYNNATNPDHAAAGFPTTCDECHTETAWVPSTWDHDNFPIYSGKHEGEWNVCADCHIGGNFNTFECIFCHEHDDPAEVEDDHQGVSGYQYVSSACFSCHPTGEK